MKARIVLAVGIAITVIVGLVLVLGTLSGPERSLGPNSDRKSTRLNSSHGSISYAVFCLKKNRMARPQNALRRNRYIAAVTAPPLTRRTTYRTTTRTPATSIVRHVDRLCQMRERTPRHRT